MELWRGVRTEVARNLVQDLVEDTVSLPVPTPIMWRAGGQYLAQFRNDFDLVTLERLQNDVLIALTAYYSGALLFTRDKHFERLRKKIPFKLELI